MTEVERRLDDLSKAVAAGQSRRRVVKLGLGMVSAAIASAFSSRIAWGQNSDGNSACAHFCQSLPPGLRGPCVSAAAHNDPTGFCSGCASDVARVIRPDGVLFAEPATYVPAGSQLCILGSQ